MKSEKGKSGSTLAEIVEREVAGHMERCRTQTFVGEPVLCRACAATFGRNIAKAVVEEVAQKVCFWCREGYPLDPESKFLREPGRYHSSKPDQHPVWHECSAFEIREMLTEARAAGGEGAK